jgi:AraC-like DNA-binding protein
MTCLEELSEATNYNYSYLSSLFRKTTSGTLADYYRRRRLETARLLIAGGEQNMTEIAALLHYSSIYTFSRAFKDEYGTSPTQYKRALNADA